MVNQAHTAPEIAHLGKFRTFSFLMYKESAQPLFCFFLKNPCSIVELISVPYRCGQRNIRSPVKGLTASKWANRVNFLFLRCSPAPIRTEHTSPLDSLNHRVWNFSRSPCCGCWAASIQLQPGMKYSVLNIVSHYFSRNTSLISRTLLNEGVYIKEGIKNATFSCEERYNLIQLSPSWFLSSKAVFTRPFGGSRTNAPPKSECNRFHWEANWNQFNGGGGTWNAEYFSH